MDFIAAWASSVMLSGLCCFFSPHHCVGDGSERGQLDCEVWSEPLLLTGRQISAMVSGLKEWKSTPVLALGSVSLSPSLGGSGAQSCSPGLFPQHRETVTVKWNLLD